MQQFHRTARYDFRSLGIGDIQVVELALPDEDPSLPERRLASLRSTASQFGRRTGRKLKVKRVAPRWGQVERIS